MKEESMRYILSEWKNEMDHALTGNHCIGIALFSDEGRLLFANHFMQSLFNEDPSECLLNPTFEKLLSLFVVVDKEMIKTTLRNLVTNALKYTYARGKVRISTRQKENSIQFTVADTGMGIPPEYLDSLFEIDCNLSREGTQREKGTGLGLILCKEFVGKHGGQIWVESEIGQGSVFHFTIPL